MGSERSMADYTFLRPGAIRQRMQCSGPMAANIDATFTTVEQLLEAVESEAELTDIDGVGEKTAETIEEWYEHREEREAQATEATVERTSSRSATVTFHGSWNEPLGIETAADTEADNE